MFPCFVFRASGKVKVAPRLGHCVIRAFRPGPYVFVHDAININDAIQICLESHKIKA